MPLNKREHFDSITHLFGGAAIIVGMIFLLKRAWGNVLYLTISLIYGVSALFLFISSFLYHFYKKENNEDTWRRKMDHVAIFFMIAGSYTPICFIYFTGITRWGLIIAQYSIVFFAIIFKPMLMNNKRGIDEIIYLMMGWMALVAIKPIIETMPLDVALYLLGGGIAYSVGAVLSATDKPKPIFGFIGGHQIFHILVLVGAFLHYVVVYLGMNHFI